ncbi:hypothetical protein SNEBB_007791 [Seison nebaliae]|nr:hypothetical protein SNEBB_007791 [Seison nebaliae]
MNRLDESPYSILNDLDTDDEENKEELEESLNEENDETDRLIFDHPVAQIGVIEPQLTGIPEPSPKQKNILINFNRTKIFFLTFFTYVVVHSSRKSLSNVKTTMGQHWTSLNNNVSTKSYIPLNGNNWNKQQFFSSMEGAAFFEGILDTVFLVVYSIGLFISGFIGERLNLKIFISCGLFVSGVCTLLFGYVPEVFHFYSKMWYVCLWGLNGLAQSIIWPSIVTVMGNWFPLHMGGRILGIWSSCASIGNIVGSVMVAAIVDSGYENAFLLSAILLIAFSIINFFTMTTTPMDLLKKNKTNSNVSREKKFPIKFRDALCNFSVITFSICYACLKLVNYSFFFWLPRYLVLTYNWKESKADYISIWYDIGSIIGAVVGGYFSDRLHGHITRTVVIFGLLIFSVPALIIYSTVSGKLIFNCTAMTFTGIFVGGPSNLISATIVNDIGKRISPVLYDGACGHTPIDAVATVTGIVDGSGSVGAAIGQIIIPLIGNRYGWYSIFKLFISMSVVAIISLMPMLRLDYRAYKYRLSRPD